MRANGLIEHESCAFPPRCRRAPAAADDARAPHPRPGCVFAVAPRGSSSSALVLKLDAKVYRPARARCLPSPGCASPASLAELRGVLREASAYAKLRVPAALPPLPSSSPRRSGRGGNASLLPSFALAGVTSLYVERAAGGAVRTNVYGILLPRLGCVVATHRRRRQIRHRRSSRAASAPDRRRSLYDATLGAGRSACVRAGRRLPLLCAAMLRSLRAAHAAGVVHNDVKPENFLFRPADALTDSLGGGSGGVASDRPHLVLIDFGLAVDAPSPDADPPATTAAVTTAAAAAGDEDDDRFEGTPAYASRNALSLGPLSPRDDCEAMLLVAGELAAAASKPWDAAPLLPWNEHEFYATKARRLSGGPKQVEDFMTCDTGGGAMPAWLRRAWALVDDRQRAAVAGGEHAPPYDDLMAVFHEAAREAACGGGGGGAAIDEADEEEGESSNSSSGSDGSGGKDWKCVRSQAESVGDHTAGEREP